jgi:hypothetical protein
MAILLAIVAAGIYRIVVFRRLLAQLEATSMTGARAGTPTSASCGLVRLGSGDFALPAQVSRHPALGRTWKVRGSDGVALDPTIVVPDTA